MKTNVLQLARRHGIHVRRAKNWRPFKLTALFRAMKPGEAITMPFSHTTAPYAIARAANVKVTTHKLKKLQDGKYLIEVVRAV